jgi:hypothetical protein
LPFKDREYAKVKQREYTKAYKMRQTPEERERQRKQQREHKKAILAAKSLEQKEQFYKNMYIQARENGQYKDATEKIIKAYHVLRNKVLSHLGNQCSSPGCRWINEDGTMGCTLKDCLQVDHVYGGGRREKEKGASLLRKVLRDTTGAYQLLCSNCNWLKRETNKEVRISPFRQEAA